MSARFRSAWVKRVTIHDPCNIVRCKELHKTIQEVAHAICSDVRKTYPNKERNYSCSAGGGVISCGPIFNESRVKSNRVKAEQIKKAEVKVIIAPCHNCHSDLEDITKAYDCLQMSTFSI